MSTGSWPGLRRWHVLAAAAAGLALVAAGGVAMLMPQHPAGQPQAAAQEDCGLVNCGAALPTASTGGGVRRPGQRPHQPSPSPTPTATPSATPDPPPSPSPSPTTPPPQAGVSVSFAVQRAAHGPQFTGTLTLVNHGSTVVSGWRVQLWLSGDHVKRAGFPAGTGWRDFQAWQFGGDVLTLTAASGSEAIPAGGSQTVTIDAHGPTTRPTNCLFNGAPCRS